MGLISTRHYAYLFFIILFFLFAIFTRKTIWIYHVSIEEVVMMVVEVIGAVVVVMVEVVGVGEVIPPLLLPSRYKDKREPCTTTTTTTTAAAAAAAAAAASGAVILLSDLYLRIAD